MFKNNKSIKYAPVIVLVLLLTACSEGLSIKDDDNGTTNDYITETKQNITTTVTKETSKNPVVTDTINNETTIIITEAITTEETTIEITSETIITTSSDVINENISMSDTVENNVTMTAESLIGIPFADGGSSPDSGFDNSGFIYYVLKQNGYVNCPRGLLEQSVMGTKVASMNDLKSGDLVFFSENGTSAQFGGIYTGSGIMINCPSPGNTVKKTDITTNYYVNNFFTGVRIL